MSDRAKVLQAALAADLAGQDGEPPKGGEAAAAGADAGPPADPPAGQAESEDDNKPVSKKAFKERIDKLIDQRDEARDEAVRLRQEMEAVKARMDQFQAALQAPRRREPEEEEEEEPLVAVRRELTTLRQQQEQDRLAVQQERRLKTEAERLRNEILEAQKEYPEAYFQDIVREMQLNPALTPRAAVKAVHEREKEREKRVLEKIKAKAEQPKNGDAARRPPTTGLPAGESPPGPALDARERKRRMAAGLAARGGLFK